MSNEIKLLQIVIHGVLNQNNQINSYVTFTLRKFVSKETLGCKEESFSGSSIKLLQESGLQQRVIWDCAIVLSRFLEKHPTLIQNKTVIELGCGLGLPGLVCSLIGARFVLLTDRFSAVPFIKKNIEFNNSLFFLYKKSNLLVKDLEWTREPTKIFSNELLRDGFEVILCSDLIFAGDIETTKDLVMTIKFLTCEQNSPMIISCHENRYIGLYANDKILNSSEKQEKIFSKLLNKVAGYNFIKSVPISEMDEHCYDENIILKIYRKQENKLVKDL